MRFSNEQKKAIEHQDGPCLVLAVPGSGKTTILLERLHRLIEAGIPPYAIASITFSKQQARDMEERFLSSHPQMRGLTFSTIHAFCYKILKNFYRQENKPIKLIEGSREYNKYGIVSRFFFESRRKKATEEDIENFFRIDGYLKNSLFTYQDFKKKYQESYPKFEEISQKYEAFKKEQALIDFDDMLIQSLQLFDKHPEILEALQERFHYLQVDEAQDTSLVQFRIIQKLAQPNNNLFMVADDDQAIYGFRGAHPAYLLSFDQSYPQAKIITMQRNYRSTQNIVQLSNHLIAKNKARFKKRPNADKKAEDPIQVFVSKNLVSQTKKVLQYIKDHPNTTTAILFRNNLSALPYMDLFEKEQIPYVNQANLKNFFRHPLIQDIQDILDFSKDTSDHILFSKIYYKLNAFLKKDFIHAIYEMNSFESVFSRLRRLEGCQNPFYREKIDHLEREFQLLEKSRIDYAIERIEKELGFAAYLDEKSKMMRKGGQIQDRILEILKFLALDMIHPMQLENRLQNLEYSSRLKKKEKAPVILSTIHGSKGLEYDTVWLVDLMQKEFPSSFALESPLLLEEERRLFYVGMTRAKKNLYIIGRQSINNKSCEYSQFIKEITKKS